MSFFGGGAARHNTAAPGFSQAHDPFASFSRQTIDDDEGVDFEDTYDGLGDQLDESNDAFNDDTFGGGGGSGGTSSSKVGTDFDFFGQTANVSNAIEEEQLRFIRQPPAAKSTATASLQAPSTAYYSSQPLAQPVRTGYEKYKTEPIQDLEVDKSIWGISSSKPAASAVLAQPVASSAAKKYMTLEEVEAAMAAQKPVQPSVESQQPTVTPFAAQDFLYARPAPAQSQPKPVNNNHAHPQPATASHHGHGHPVTILQRPQSMGAAKPAQPPPTAPSPAAVQQPQEPIKPTQILQNPNRLSQEATRGVHGHGHRSQGSVSQVPQVIPQQASMPHLSEHERAAYLDQETKRAKRNHKIHQLSMGNGLMTPQDKNFVTRIQLQQLVAATGNPIDQGNDNALAEDFYYQVHSQIRGSQRQNPSQPLNNFAQTYLYQTGNRQGTRRQGRVAENHVQRMEQQVQRAVEAAKNKPKNPQLVIAGSLGKISFSNAKTPKPLLNIKRTESSSDRAGSMKRDKRTLDKKTVLRNIERVYGTLMELEDHARNMPPPPANPVDMDLQPQHKEWLDRTQALNDQLWIELKVHEPIGATDMHPFIAFLSFSKGKKAMPRVFRHLSFEKRATVLTIIVLHLDQLDVVRDAQVDNPDLALNAALRENIELFSLAVMPTLFQFFNETELDIVTGVLGLVLKLNIDAIAKTRIGTSMLTLILSRAELLKQAGGGNPQTWAEW
jgi:DNA topoisomerase 2-associated protein PAT1